VLLAAPQVLALMQSHVPWGERLIIDPFLPTARAARGASLDFHLGTRFSVPRRRRAVKHDPLATNLDGDIASAEFFVPLGDQVVLHPGQLVLGTTLEWYCFPDNVVAVAEGRSIWGRRGVLVATATAVQPGSTGTITLELSNVGEIAIVLQPGAAIGQLFFHAITRPDALGQDRQHRLSTFSAESRPVHGVYSASEVERYLWNASKRSRIEQAGAAHLPPT
jgi:dCTP deaminase